MPDSAIIIPSVLNGLTTGGLYALVALGLTLIYGVLHIINFAHGALLMLGLYAVYFLNVQFGIDPYVALLIVPPAMFALGYALQRGIIGRASHGRDENILLVTLGLSIIIENLSLFFFRSDTRTVDTPYSFDVIEIFGAFLPYPKVVAFIGALVTAALLWLLMSRTDLGRAIRALAKERKGAQLVGINADHVFAMSFGLGIACLGVAACLLLPSYYVNPQVGGGFVLIAFTIVVLGGMGSFVGALIGGLIIGVVEALGGLFLGESLGQIGIFLIFILVLIFRPTGLFGAKA
ncbi:branched-chain amino acid ABC transporter permease [Hoeflea alexandrii]|jgi:branched-chain amino acid transport system permease protein|uniref:Branched-chain amino acid ABC transporter permease n=1 Tax=Hoeflea alexandrii TaxID=288436 RepID=A0ABT1CZV2_9HYPH|nr:branched-chain amino acid ABC transporter permease [Hoeflea alexandrii]MBV6650421.1 branched-chain amino acid ABC transporter permease [Hoeflea sp.]MCO6411091.1 branched-chain amino acid ABC transporter permease [Hoeflea alexandrii]MCY0151080.1 branched-chain amino acid ABC transporter permease [Hoeflea alexandrii]